MYQISEYVGGEWTECTRSEGHAVIQKWRTQFSSPVKESTGKWTIDSVDWHTFSHGYHPFATSTHPEFGLSNHSIDSTFVWSTGNGFDEKVFLVSPPMKRRWVDLLDFLDAHTNYFDLYIVGIEYDWTCVLTHEEDFEIIYAESS